MAGSKHLNHVRREKCIELNDEITSQLRKERFKRFDQNFW